MCERHESAGSFRVFRTFRVLRGPSACTPHLNHASRFLEVPHRAAAGGAAPPFPECQGPLLSIRSLSEEVRTQRRFGNILPIPSRTAANASTPSHWRCASRLGESVWNTIVTKCAKDTKAPAAFVSFAHFASFVVQVLALPLQPRQPVPGSASSRSSQRPRQHSGNGASALRGCGWGVLPIPGMSGQERPRAQPIRPFRQSVFCPTAPARRATIPGMGQCHPRGRVERLAHSRNVRDRCCRFAHSVKKCARSADSGTYCLFPSRTAANASTPSRWGERVMVGRKRLEHDSHEMCERHESAGIFRVFRTFRVLRGPSACTPHSNHASRFLEAPHLAHSRNVRDRCCRFAHSVKKCARSADSGTTAYSITNRCQRSRTQPLEVQVTVGRKRLDHDSHEMCERHESAGSFRVFRTFRVLRGPSACTPHSNHASRFLETPHRAAAGGAAPPFREWASAIRRYGWSHRPIPGMSGQERPRAQPIRPFRQSVFYPSPSSTSSASSRYLMS
jgi:hypothetical protein